MVSGYGVKLYINVIEQKLYETKDRENFKRQTLENLDKFFIDNRIDLLFYSPTIKTVISFNTVDYFDYTFAFGECNSIVFCEFL